MHVLIAGGGICGLGTALLLARDGHDVTIVERDAEPLPDSAAAAWDDWERKGVAQFRQPHNFMPGLRTILQTELPDLQDTLRDAGASRYDFLNPLPSLFSDHSARPIDEKLWTYTARRPLAEWVFAHAAHSDRRITCRRGLKVSELLSGPSASAGIPHVTGIRTQSGEEIRADLVVDATGRQSPSSQWLSAIGARPVYEEQADCGFIYYTRYFRGVVPQRLAPGLMPLGTMSILTLPGDNGTWSVTIFTASGDQPLKNLRHEEKWTNVVRECPLHAHWLDGEPITPMLAMSGIVDRYRRFVVDDEPVATGFVGVADAWACTNPSAGRGLTIGFLHALQLRDTLRDSAQTPRALVEDFDRRTEQYIAPWYDAQIAVDRYRFAEMEALRDNRLPPIPAGDLARSILTLLSTMMASPDLFRAGLEYIGTITPVQEILRRPEVANEVRAAGEAMQGAPPNPPPGPTRQRLLDLMV